MVKPHPIHQFNQGGTTPCGRSAQGLRVTVGGEVTCKVCRKIVEKARAKARPLDTDANPPGAPTEAYLKADADAARAITAEIAKAISDA